MITHTFNHDTVGKPCSWLMHYTCMQGDVLSPSFCVFVSLPQFCMQYCIGVSALCLHFNVLQISSCYFCL